MLWNRSHGQVENSEPYRRINYTTVISPNGGCTLNPLLVAFILRKIFTHPAQLTAENVCIYIFKHIARMVLRNVMGV